MVIKNNKNDEIVRMLCDPYVLDRLKGGHTGTCHITLRPVDSIVKKVALFCFGHLARFIEFCLRHVIQTPSPLFRFALEAKMGMNMEVSLENEKKEKPGSRLKVVAKVALGALLIVCALEVLDRLIPDEQLLPKTEASSTASLVVDNS